MRTFRRQDETVLGLQIQSSVPESCRVSVVTMQPNPWNGQNTLKTQPSSNACNHPPFYFARHAFNIGTRKTSLFLSFVLSQFFGFGRHHAVTLSSEKLSRWPFATERYRMRYISSHSHSSRTQHQTKHTITITIFDSIIPLLHSTLPYRCSAAHMWPLRTERWHTNRYNSERTL